MKDKLIQGVEKLDKVQQILGDKFAFPELRFFTDHEKELTPRQFEALKALGWEPQSPNSWFYEGKTD